MPADRPATRTTDLPGLHWPAGDAARPVPLVLFHGFAGSSDAWRPFVAHLAGRPVHAVDLPGHAGRPPWPGRAFAQDRLAGLLPVARAVVCGYSLGGRLALALAAAHPERCAGIVTIGAHPGLVSARERRERRAADERWAVLIEREGTARFAAAWSAQPLFATQRRLDRDVLARQDRIRRSHDPAGLAAAMRGFSLGRMPDLRPALARCRVPALCLAGALDERFAMLAREIASVMLDARSALVPDCGHNPVLERPDATAALVDAFWKEIA